MPGLSIALAWRPATRCEDLLKRGLGDDIGLELSGFYAPTYAFKNAHHLFSPHPLPMYATGMSDAAYVTHFVELRQPSSCHAYRIACSRTIPTVLAPFPVGDMMRAAGYAHINAWQRSPPATLGRDTEGLLRAHHWEVGGDAQ
jgi:hypothetical protein